MVSINTTSLTIGGRSFNKNKSGYPALPTVFSGVSISFGADSCLEHPEPTTASISLWVPKNQFDYMPKLDEEVIVEAQVDSSPSVRVFSGYVDKITLADNHKQLPTASQKFHTNSLTAAGWNIIYRTAAGFPTVPAGNKTVSGGVVTVTVPADRSVVNNEIRLYGNITDFIPVTPGMAKTTIYSASSGTRGTFTIDQYSSSRTKIGASKTGNNLNGNGVEMTLDPATAFIFIQAIDVYAPSTATTVDIGPFSIMELAAPDPQNVPEFPGYRINISCSDASAKAGRLRVGSEPWYSVGGMQRLSDIARLAAPSGVKFFDPGYTLGEFGYYSMPAEIGGEDMVETVVRARDVDSVNALEIYQDTAMSAGLTVGSINNEVTTNFKLLLPQVLNKDANGAYVTEQTTRNSNRPLPVIPVKAIVDSAFALDTTETVNQIKVNYFVRKGTVWPGGEFTAVEETSMSIVSPSAPLSAPVTRTLQGENQVKDPYASLKGPALDPVNSLAIRARAALSAQSVPRWRLASGMQLVLSEIPYSVGLVDLIEEAGRFGQLVRIDGAPEFIGSYQRIKSGRIVLGENPSLEFELEPVDYSGPTALTRNTAFYDPTTKAITIGDLKTITSGMLRSIGAR